MNKTDEIIPYYNKRILSIKFDMMEGMFINYAWFFFRKILKKDLSQKIIDLLNSQLIESELRIASEIPQYIFKKYSNGSSFDLRTNETKNHLEIGIEIIKKLENFEYNYPILRILIGQNNILMYINKINKYTFPNLSNVLIFQKTMTILSESLDLFLQEKLAMAILEDFLINYGNHNCYLNCGECCDGTDRTKSPLEGGMYCPALTNIGNFCIYHLLKVPFPKDKEICGEFYCGDFQCSSDIYLEGLGCNLRKFVPQYSDQDLTEFFNLFNLIQKKNLEEILNNSKRAVEVNTYWKSINKIIDISKGKEKHNIILYNKFLYSLGTYNFDKCIEYLYDLEVEDQKCLSKLEVAKLKSIMVDLIDWKHSFFTRKNRYSKCVKVDI